MEETSTPNPAAEIEDWPREALEALASFLKTSFLYPANNERVLHCSDRLLGAIQALQRETGKETHLQILDDRFAVAGRHIDSDLPIVEWLREAMIKTAVGGIALSSDANRDSLAGFAEHLRKNFAGNQIGFSAMWSEVFAGVQPFQLRFSGRHGSSPADPEAILGTGQGGSASDKVLSMILENEDLIGKLEKLKTDINALVQESAEPMTTIDLLHPIRDALPAEALLDPGNACQVVAQVLSTSGSRIQNLIATGKKSDQDAMQILATEVGRQFFRRSTHELEDLDFSRLPEGRPEDEEIVDDLDAMLSELRALPNDPNLRLGADPARDLREVIGVNLHLLVTCSQDHIQELVADNLRRLLDDHPEHRDLCQPYLELSLDPEFGDPQTRDYKAFRVLGLIVGQGWSELLEGRKYLTPDIVERSFPHLFPQFLDTLRAEDSEDRRALQNLLKAVGTERITEAAKRLVETGELQQGGRIKALLRSGARGLEPIVQKLARSRQPEVRAELVEYLRHLDLPAAETTALRVVRPITELTPEYLSQLAKLIEQPDLREALLEESGRLTRLFLRKTAGQEELIDARIRAAVQLKSLPSRDNLQALDELRREGGLLALSKKARELRQAAKLAYKHLHTRLKGGIR